jgi:Glyoxalase-like domain
MTLIARSNREARAFSTSEPKGATSGLKSQIDHIVVVAHTLEQGVAWCEATLGITSETGGEHPQFGTHNRLFKIATPNFPLAYFEIIAIKNSATNNIAVKAINTPANSQKISKNEVKNSRWFDMDDAALQAAVAKEPRLVHFVAQTDDIQASRTALKALGIDRGPAVEASRHTRKGRLEWKITVRDDGQRLFSGGLPSLIQWGKTNAAEPLRLHPRNTLPRSGVSLQSVAVTSPTPDKLQAAYAAIGLANVTLTEGDANITVTLKTPKGLVELQSFGI